MCPVIHADPHMRIIYGIETVGIMLYGIGSHFSQVEQVIPEIVRFFLTHHSAPQRVRL